MGLIALLLPARVAARIPLDDDGRCNTCRQAAVLVKQETGGTFIGCLECGWLVPIWDEEQV